MAQIDSILKNEDLVTLVQTAGELTSSIDLNELLQLILTKAGQLTGSPDGAVLLYNKERDTLYFAGAIGQNAAAVLEQFGEFSGQQVPVIGSKAGTVFKSEESIVVGKLESDPEHFKGVDREVNQESQCMICVPLVTSDGCLGVMQLLNKSSGEYDIRDKTILEMFARYAAIALRNASIFEELIAHMGLYASREFRGGIKELIAQLKTAPHTERLTILFADMRGFRLLCQVLNSPVKVVDITKQFINMLSDQVLRNGGLVNKFLGDGILALFRNGDHARRAVKCALAMLDSFEELRSTWRNVTPAKLTFLNIGVGITTDDVIIGTIGNSKIRDFTVIGTGVNLAAAFEKEARNGRQILVDHPTYESVKEMMLEIEGPFDYELRQPDQISGHWYLQYHIKKLQVKVFISHSSEDQEFIEKNLIPYLEENGITCWYSKKAIKAGDSWPKSITEGLDESDWFLVIVSKSSETSKWVKEEVEMAVALDKLRDKIISIKIDGTDTEKVHSFLRHKQFISAQNNDRYLSDLLSKLKEKI